MSKYRKPYKEHVKIQFLVKFITDLAVAVCLGYFLVLILGNRYSIVGNSMNEVLTHEDIVLVDKISYEIGEPQRFDVILFESSDVNAGKKYVKRIIGLPGEKIQIKDGKILVNDMILLDDINDNSILTPGLASEAVVLGENEYFVLGDNRNNSEDSRFYTIGNVKEDEIIGKIWMRIYPLSSFGFIE